MSLKIYTAFHFASSFQVKQQFSGISWDKGEGKGHGNHHWLPVPGKDGKRNKKLPRTA
jgi:hypothetical protein